MAVPTNATMPTNRQFCILLILIALGVMAATAVGAEKPVGNWDDVQKIRAGMAVQVMQGDLIRLPGRLVSTAGDGLILHVKGTDRSFARDTLLSVAVQRRKTAKGAVIGLLVGLALAYPSAKLQGAGAAVGGLVFDTAIGAAVGALSKGYQTVYRPSQPRSLSEY